MLTMEEYKAFLTAVRNATGQDILVPDEDGLVSVRVEDTFNLSLQFIPHSGMILCFVEVATLPEDAPAATYRELLAGGLFGHDTAGGYFTLEASSNIVIYNYFFNGEETAKDVDGFVFTLEKILQLCEMWSERITDSLSARGEKPPMKQYQYDNRNIFA